MYETGVQSNPEPTLPSRPRQVKTLSILLIVFGVLGLLVAFLLMSIISDSAGHGQSVSPVAYVLVFAQIVVSAAQATSGVFVWQGRSWARVLAIVVCSVNIVAAVASLFIGAFVQAGLGAVINGALIRQLNKYEVQAWCNK